MEEELEFVPERFLAKQKRNGRVLYLVQWRGFEQQDTWEPKEYFKKDINVPKAWRDLKEYKDMKKLQDNMGRKHNIM